MTATAHALVGGAIAAAIPDPVLGISLSFTSHPILDMIPHWDFGRGWRMKTKIRLFTEGASDLILGVVFAYLLFGLSGVNIWYFLACVFVSELWDLAEIPYWFFNWRFAPFSTIYKFQSRIQGRAKDVSVGILTQVITIAVIVVVLNSLTAF